MKDYKQAVENISQRMRLFYKNPKKVQINSATVAAEFEKLKVYYIPFSIVKYSSDVSEKYKSLCPIMPKTKGLLENIGDDRYE